jgi:aquaporin related protein
MLAAEKHRGTFLAPVGIGLALFVAELASVLFTGGSLNPARSFGPDVVTGKFDNTHWVYWIGPFLGAVLAVLFYRFIKMLEYETANPGADATRPNSPVLPTTTAPPTSARDVDGGSDVAQRV